MESVNQKIFEFDKQLSEQLKRPEKKKIVRFTVIAEGFLKDDESALLAQKVCENVEFRLKQADNPTERLAHLYLIDSMVKSLPNSPYAKLFAVGIVAAFVEAFAATEEDSARARMFDLRRSWVGVFPDSVMRELDLAVRAVDPGWPVLDDLPAVQGHKRRSHSQQAPAVALAAGNDVDMRRGWSEYRTAHLLTTSGGVRDNGEYCGSGGGDLQQFNTASQLPADPDGLDQQQAAIQELLSRVKPEALDLEARRQLLGCVRDLQRLSAPGSAGSRLAESLAATLQIPSSSSGNQQQRELIPTHVDSALDKLLGGLAGSTAGSTAAPDPGKPAAMPPQAATHLPSSGAGRGLPVLPGTMDNAVKATNYTQEIGCDPRLLAPIKERFEASKDIQVDGQIKRLVLDRVQPLIVERGEVRAVRFKFLAGSAVFLEWEGGPAPVRLRPMEFNKVLFGRRPLIVCLGGPYHELVIHGKPFNVPFNEPKLIPVRAGFLRGVYLVRLQAVMLSNGVPVTPALDICPPIPRQWLSWASTGAFGAVNLLHKPPLNPVQRMAQASASSAAGLLHPHPHPHRWYRAASAFPSDVARMVNHLVKTGVIAGGAGVGGGPGGGLHGPGGLTGMTAAEEVVAAAASMKRKWAEERREAKRLRMAAAAAEAGGEGGSGSDSDSDSNSDLDPADIDSDVDLPLDFTDLVEEKLEQRYPEVAHRLVGGYKCPQCTLRFTRGHSSASFKRHMDEHYLRRVIQRANPPAKFRGWFAHWSHLIKADEFGFTAPEDTVEEAAAGASALSAAGGSSAVFDAQQQQQMQAQQQQLQSQASATAAAGTAATSSEAVVVSGAAVSRVPARTRPELNVCGVCYEQFDTKWDDDTEDWLLQDCVELAGGIYHPVCAEDADVGDAATAAAAEAAAKKKTGTAEASAGSLEVAPPPLPPLAAPVSSTMTGTTSSSSAAEAVLSILRGAARLQ